MYVYIQVYTYISICIYTVYIEYVKRFIDRSIYPSKFIYVYVYMYIYTYIVSKPEVAVARP